MAMNIDDVASILASKSLQSPKPPLGFALTVP